MCIQLIQVIVMATRLETFHLLLKRFLQLHQPVGNFLGLFPQRLIPAVASTTINENPDSDFSYNAMVPRCCYLQLSYQWHMKSLLLV